jgi:hypothetical protein
MLLSLPEQQRRQLLEGDWDIKEGAAFTEFDRNVHVLSHLKFQATGLSLGHVTMGTEVNPVLFGLLFLLMNS